MRHGLMSSVRRETLALELSLANVGKPGLTGDMVIARAKAVMSRLAEIKGTYEVLDVRIENNALLVGSFEFRHGHMCFPLRILTPDQALAREVMST